MPDGIDADFSELLKLSADLSAAGVRVRQFARKAIQVTAHRIKEAWREGADISRASAIVGPYEHSITYDTEVKASEIRAEIGPEVDRPGGTAGFLEDGGSGVLVPPIHAGRNAVEANEQDFIDGLVVALVDAIESDVTPVVGPDE